MKNRGCLWAAGGLGLLVMVLFSCGAGVLLGRAGGAGGPGASWGDAVAVLYVTGTIESGEGETFLGGDSTRSGEILRQIKQVMRDPSIKGVVLRVDSPGGSAEGSDEIYSALIRLRKSGKPLVASMGALAASGGYYVSAAADKIVANPNTLTGSIGVISILPNLQELLDKLGVRTYVFKSGSYKDSSSGLRALSQDEEQVWQSLIDDSYNRFVQVIVEGRGLDEARVRQLADGRIYSAPQAKANGLIDDYGDLDEAVDLAGSLAGIKGKPRVVEYQKRGGFSGLLGSVRGGQEITLERLTGLPRHRTLQYLYVDP